MKRWMRTAFATVMLACMAMPLTAAAESVSWNFPVCMEAMGLASAASIGSSGTPAFDAIPEGNDAEGASDGTGTDGSNGVSGSSGATGSTSASDASASSLVPTRTIESAKGSGWSSEQKNYVFEGNGTVFFRKISFTQTGGKYVTSYALPGNTATLSWFDSKGNLIREPLKDGKLPMNSLLYLQSDTYSMIVGQCFVYASMGGGTIRDVSGSRSAVVVKKQASGGWSITSTFSRTSGAYGILWGVMSKKQLLDPTTTLNKFIWPNYDVVKQARIGYDGYYFASPSTYSPTATNAFWRIPDMYLASSLVRTGGSLASDLLGNAMLVNALPNLNASGYFPSLPKSTWLKKLYNLDGGFFDTRFNADAARTYLIGWRKTGNPAYLDTATKLAAWFMKYGGSHHFTVRSGAREGWLIQDYGATKGAKPTHCALNHQLAEINFFLDLASDCTDAKTAAEYAAFAERMLEGIRLTRSKWIMSNGNLEYAYMPDGKMGLKDYPYLTYNDLMETQTLLTKRDGKRDADLDVLMASKKKWMDAQGVTEYRKY